ncbi:MAG: hypothetical protein WBG92_13050, partial [Thiohalocapsa sp.]
MALPVWVSALPNPAQAQAQCVPSATNTFECSGSWPAGLGISTLVPTTTTTVFVDDLTSNIGPESFGIDWRLGGSSSSGGATRTLNIDMGNFTVSDGPAVLFTSLALNNSAPHGFPLELVFIGDAVGAELGDSTITVANRGTLFRSAGAAGARFGDIRLTLEGKMSGLGGIRANTTGGSGGSGSSSFAGGNGAAGGDLFFVTTGEGVSVSIQG